MSGGIKNVMKKKEVGSHENFEKGEKKK